MPDLGVRREPLVVLPDLLSQIFFLHFEQSFGVGFLDTADEEAEEATDKVADSSEHGNEAWVEKWPGWPARRGDWQKSAAHASGANGDCIAWPIAHPGLGWKTIQG